MTTANLTVQDNDTVDQYVSVGESQFSFTFPITDAAELKVSKNHQPLVYGADWTLDPNSLNVPGGGSITLADGSTPGDVITLWLDLPIERTSGYAAGAATLLPEDLNADAATNIRIAQMLRRDTRRSLRLPVDDTLPGQTMELPPAPQRLGKLLGFSPTNGRMDLFTIADVGGTLVPISRSLIGSLLYPKMPFEQSVNVVDEAYPYGNVLRYGADREGQADSTQAFEDCIKACVHGTLLFAVRRTRMVIPTGLYRLNPAGADGLLFEEALYGGGFEVAGEGEQNTVLLFENTSGPCITIKGNLFDFHDFTVYADTDRQGGSGDGVVINAGLSTTSYRGRLARVAIKNQPTDGLACTRIEHHEFDHVWVYNSGRYGFNLAGGPGQLSWNLFLNCRSQVSGSHGWLFDTVVNQNTFINAEGLSFGATDDDAAGFVVKGRDNIFINPDSENFEHITGSTQYTGFEISGTGHVIERGYIGDVQYPIRLVSANRCSIRHPTITAGTSGIGGTNAVEVDSNSAANEYSLRQSYTGYTNPIFPVEGRTRDIINFDGQYFGRAGTWTPDLRVGGSATGITYASRTGKWRCIGDVVHCEFDITLSAKGAGSGALTVLGLPFNAAADTRGYVSVSFVSNGASITNLAGSAVTPGSPGFNLRSQGATGVSDLNEGNLTDDTRISGAIRYLRSTS